MSPPEDDKKGQSPLDSPTAILRSSDPVRIAKIAGCEFFFEGDETRIVIPVLEGTISVFHPSIRFVSSPDVDSFVLRLLALLYLSNTNGAEPSNKWIPYRELPGGRFYEPVFKRAVEEPIVASFGSDIDSFAKACEKLGGRREDFGDCSYSFRLFPKVLLCFVIWRGDEEFPPDAQVMFDSNCRHHLGAFELRMGAEEITKRITRQSKS